MGSNGQPFLVYPTDDIYALQNNLQALQPPALSSRPTSSHPTLPSPNPPISMSAPSLPTLETTGNQPVQRNQDEEEDSVDENLRISIPSRSGFLVTPLSADSSPSPSQLMNFSPATNVSPLILTPLSNSNLTIESKSSGSSNGSDNQSDHSTYSVFLPKTNTGLSAQMSSFYTPFQSDTFQPYFAGSVGSGFTPVSSLPATPTFPLFPQSDGSGSSFASGTGGD